LRTGQRHLRVVDGGHPTGPSTACAQASLLRSVSLNHLGQTVNEPDRHYQMIQGPIARTLLWFALPILGSTILQALNESINAVWIGHYLGESALTAVSDTTPILFLLLYAAFGVSMATTILVGQSLGASNIPEAKRVVGTGVSFFAALSVTIATVGYLATPVLLGLMNTPADAMPQAIVYLRVMFVALPPMYFFNFLITTLRGAGDAKTPLLFMGLSVLLEVALNPIFIFGFGPIPKLGIGGSALACLVSLNLSLLALLATLRVRRHFLWIGRSDLALLRPDWTILRALVVKGLPMGLQTVVMSSSAVVMMTLVNAYGSRTVAAFGAAVQLWTYVQMPALALGAAVSAMAAQNIGAQRWDRVSKIAGFGVAYNFLLGGALIGVLYLSNSAVLGMFLPHDASALGLAEHLNAIVMWSLLFFGISLVLLGVVRSTGAVWPPVTIMIMTLGCVRLPFAWLMQERMGADAIWWSFPAGYLMAILLTVAYYKAGAWRQARMFEPVLDDGLVPEAVG
jgi:putative MATE family efflux protein